MHDADFFASGLWCMAVGVVLLIVSTATLEILFRIWHISRIRERDQFQRKQLRQQQDMICDLEQECRRIQSAACARECNMERVWQERVDAAEAKMGQLERELRVKDSMLKALEGKLAV